MVLVSACTFIPHIPDIKPTSVNALADACAVAGVTEQIGGVGVTNTGIVDGVPAGAVFGFVSVAWAVIVSVPPTSIVGDASDAVT